MKILVTGATGFIGRYVVENLIENGNEVLIAGRSQMDDNTLSSKCNFAYLDIEKNNYKELSAYLDHTSRVIHLAWSGLPNFNHMSHLEFGLFHQYNFIKYLVNQGIRDITITGTCLEYGLREGQLSVDMVTNPIVPYGIAKDSLRKFLFSLNSFNNFNLKWVRLFYMYGDGQHSKSLLSQLSEAVKNREKSFNMSMGDQLRDYMHVRDVAKDLVNIARNIDESGIYQICNESPISILDFVNEYLARNNESIELNRGYYSYPSYEPMAFWGKKKI